MEFPLVSVGLPVYNRPLGLKKCLDHLLQQTYANLEIIISDNCSTDPEVQNVILQFASKDKRIKHFLQPENLGLEGNFNFVYEMATADYFIWMSDDDYFDSNYIEECVGILEKNPDYVLCSGQAVYYTDEQFTFKEDMMPLYQKRSFTRASRFFNRMQQNGKFYGVFRNKLLAAEPLGKHIGCDWSFMAKMAILGKLSFTPSTAYHRAIGGNSVNRKRLVERYGYTGLKKIFLESYGAYLIPTNIFSDPAVKKQFGFFKRQLLMLVVFIKIHRLQLINSIRKRTKRF